MYDCLLYSPDYYSNNFLMVYSVIYLLSLYIPDEKTIRVSDFHFLRLDITLKTTIHKYGDA